MGYLRLTSKGPLTPAQLAQAERENADIIETINASPIWELPSPFASSKDVVLDHYLKATHILLEWVSRIQIGSQYPVETTLKRFFIECPQPVSLIIVNEIARYVWESEGTLFDFELPGKWKVPPQKNQKQENKQIHVLADWVQKLPYEVAYLEEIDDEASHLLQAFYNRMKVVEERYRNLAETGNKRAVNRDNDGNLDRLFWILHWLFSQVDLNTSKNSPSDLLSPLLHMLDGTRTERARTGDAVRKRIARLEKKGLKANPLAVELTKQYSAFLAKHSEKWNFKLKQSRNVRKIA